MLVEPFIYSILSKCEVMLLYDSEAGTIESSLFRKNRWQGRVVADAPHFEFDMLSLRATMIRS